MLIHFNSNPQVKRNRDTNIVQEAGIAQNLATVTSIRGHMTIQEESFADDQAITLVLADAQPEIVTVLYSAQSSVGNEKGIIVVSETNSGYATQVTRHSDNEFMEHIDFSTTWTGSYLNLIVTGSGAGATTEFRWRTSPFNSLDILPSV
jgi:hypothetical protein